MEKITTEEKMIIGATEIVSILKKALAFYADIENYSEIDAGAQTYLVIFDESDFDTAGSIARKALAEVQS